MCEFRERLKHGVTQDIVVSQRLSERARWACRSIGLAGAVPANRPNQVPPMNIYLTEAKQALDRAARKAEQARCDYNNAVKEWKAAKTRWEKLSEAQIFAEADLAAARQRALDRGDTALAALLVPEPR